MITKRRLLLSSLSLIALAVSVLAQQPSAPSVDRLRQTITYLASDTLDGRRTGTQGANDAAEYIAGDFFRYGLKPGIQVATAPPKRRQNLALYLQPFPYVSQVELGRNNLLYVNPGRADDMMQFMAGEDWMPLGFSTNAEIGNAEFVFAGYGISSAELKYDDYANGIANGRVAVVFAGTPDGDNPHGQFAQAGQIRFKVAAARAAGARALVIIATEEKFKDDRMTRLSYDNSGEAGIPVVVVSRKLAERLLAAQDQSLSDYLKIADARTAPPRTSIITGLKLSFTVNVVRKEAPSFNVIGILPGSDPKLKDEAVVIGAHYDHLGRGGEGSLAARPGEIHHGADDNASGVAGMLELARIMSSQNPKPRRTVVFIAFGGEEEGLIGSNYYVNHPAFPIANTVAMINMDMIGRLKEDKLSVGGIGTANEWRSLVGGQNVAEAKATASVANVASVLSSVVNAVIPANTETPMKVDNGAVNKTEEAKSEAPAKTEGTASLSLETTRAFALTLNEDGYGPSDHSSFYSKKIPVLFFWTGTHEDYHKPSDTADKINYEGEARIVAYVARIFHDIDNTDRRPTYAVAKSDSQGRSTGFRVYLGTIPTYGDSDDGLKLDGVRDGSPAAKAGLKAGDKIVKLAGRDVKNVYDYTYALGEMKAGQEYEVDLIRDGQRLTVRIIPEARK